MRYNWSCTICGMSSGRRFSVKRHVLNIHSGHGAIIPFIEYVSGKRNESTEKLQIGNSSGYRQSNAKGLPNFEDLTTKIKIELENDLVRKIVSKITKPDNDPYFLEMAQLFRTKITADWIKEYGEEIRKGIGS